MAINMEQNRHYGPGGGTRHLQKYGGELDSTSVIKVLCLLDMVDRKKPKKLNANNIADNSAVNCTTSHNENYAALAA